MTPAVRKDLQIEAEEWEAEIKRLQGLLSVETSRNSLKSQEVPQLEKQIASDEDSLPTIASSKDAVCCFKYEYVMAGIVNDFLGS